MTEEGPRNSLWRQHPGQSWGAAIPREITPEFVRETLQDRVEPSRRVAGFARTDHPLESGSPQSPATMP